MKLIFVIISLPIIGIFLYTALYPRESFLIGKRWQYKNENLEPSDAVIKQNRVGSIVCIIIVLIALIAILFRDEESISEILSGISYFKSIGLIQI